MIVKSRFIPAHETLNLECFFTGIEITEPVDMFVNGLKICTFQNSQIFITPINWYCLYYGHLSFNKDVTILYTEADESQKESLANFHGTIDINGTECEVRNGSLGIVI